MTTIQQLQEEIVACARCPRLVEHREEVAWRKRRMYLDWEYWGRPLPSFGDPDARLLIVGLAPAAHGGNRTGRMFTGDRSGDWVFGTLHRFGFASSPDSRHRDDGLVLKDAYITAALHCAPPANKPSREEMANCQPYLLQELELLSKVQVVVTLGKIAFDTYLGTFPARGLQLPSPRPHFGHNVDNMLTDGKVLIGSYHPSQQNTQTGRLTPQMFNSVFQKARGLLH
ncbi:MAG TPA: uracil-DNA glycosylase [Dehalococcoidia bacterium]|jgi:uracil-DNA glycosylase family 4|nr:uracil-DNA glycosylase [Dehalococcoidia bacterium]